METAFKFVFFLAILIFCLVIVGFFLLFLKVLLLFMPEIHLMGLLIKFS
jgi:hypothetical protein